MLYLGPLLSEPVLLRLERGWKAGSHRSFSAGALPVELHDGGLGRGCLLLSRMPVCELGYLDGMLHCGRDVGVLAERRLGCALSLVGRLHPLALGRLRGDLVAGGLVPLLPSACYNAIRIYACRNLSALHASCARLGKRRATTRTLQLAELKRVCALAGVFRRVDARLSEVARRTGHAAHLDRLRSVLDRGAAEGLGLLVQGGVHGVHCRGRAGDLRTQVCSSRGA
mmetsp:Transcript_41056/g.101303  ORF Transcript_41056/g.101303 Transcript_41056/m.101303 type:complete len:226 (-) Transcript_41056:1327-2004(-)